MVKAIRIHEFGGPEVLEWENVEVGDPAPGQVRLRHTAVGFNFLDIQVRRGVYPVLPELPAILGAEAAGVVEALGPGVKGLAVGQRVAYAATQPGAYAEERVIDAATVIALPDSVADVTAAASMLKGTTAEYLINRCYPVNVGEVALVHAAAGGVGLFLCQWLKYLGVTVIAGVGSDDKKETVLAHGAAYAVNTRTEDFTAVAREVTGGAGVDVVYDSVGPDVYAGSLDSLKPRGYYVNFGNASGPLPPLDAVELNVKGSLFFTKASARFYLATRAERENSAAALFEVMAEGAVKPVIGQRYPLSDAARAHIDVADRITTGSTVFMV